MKEQTQSEETTKKRPGSAEKRERFKDLLPDRMHVRSFWGRAITTGAGLGLIPCGVLSSLIPIIPRFVLAMIGLILLGTTSQKLRSLINAADRWCADHLRHSSRQCQRSARKSRIASQRTLRRFFPPRGPLAANGIRSTP